MNAESNALDAAIATGASKATYAGAGTTVTSWLLSSEMGILAGIVLGVCGLCVQWYYRAKQDRREEREHQARMKSL